MSITTIVLVHGVLLTSSAWIPVQSYLQNRNINVVTIDVPERAHDHIKSKDASLMLAAEKVCKVVNMQTGPVIVAGHSQGGAVITEASGLCGSRINALVYIAAVVPKNGENDMVAESFRLGDEALQYNQSIFNSIPKFYIKTTQDKIISPATQDKYIAREHFQKIYSLNSSHTPFVSQPHKLGRNLDEIAHYIGESAKQE